MRQKRKSRSSEVEKPAQVARDRALAASGLITIETLRTRASEMGNRGAWDEIAELGRLPLEAVAEADRLEAERFLPRAKIIGLCQAGTDWRSLSKAKQAELRKALLHLVALPDLPAFYNWPEFALLREIHPLPLDGVCHLYRHLTDACREEPRMQWLRELRNCVAYLSHGAETGRWALRNVENALGHPLANTWASLESACRAARELGAYTADEHLGIRVFELEAAVALCEPWERGRVADAIRTLPCPALSAEQPLEAADEYAALTPEAWAFALELMGVPDFKNLSQRYPEPFRASAYEAMRLVAISMTGPPETIDTCLTDALQLLFAYQPSSSPAIDTLAMRGSDGDFLLTLGCVSPLNVPSVDALLLRIFERAPPAYSRSRELGALYRVFATNREGSPLEDEIDADESMPGLGWLCAQSLRFQLAAANAVMGTAARVRLFVGALYRSAITGEQLPTWPFDGIGAEAAISGADASTVLDAIERLAPVRSALDPVGRDLWRNTVGAVFGLLVRAKADVVRTHALAKVFCNDLLDAGDAPLAGHIAHLAGDVEAALEHYLNSLDWASANGEHVCKAIRALWANADDVETMQRLVAQLEAAEAGSLRSKTIRTLRIEAHERLKSLSKQHQFEKTAVSRWPSLSAPARKLLGVLATIQRFSDFHELGEYAGMDNVWAQRHYRKLVELGMVLERDDQFSINPAIVPFLERESQHSVVGRIVRAQGTTAVKQVFNSQREFVVYQIVVQLCPNHLVFPNSSLQSIMTYDRMKELVSEDDFGYYLRASVDIVVVSSTTYLPLLAIEVDSVWHDTERQQRNDDKKDRLFAAAGIPFMRLRQMGSPSEHTVRAQVAEHLDELVHSLRTDLPGYEQARGLLEDLASTALPR